jgi:glycosyltransferase involved in cell wall biosynthesis
MRKPKIAILATSLVPPHPAGTQILEVVNDLSNDFDFTVYASEVDEKIKDKVVFKRVPIPLFRPLLLRYVVQYFLFAFLVKKKKLFKKYDIIHCIEATSPYASVTTMHFCGDAAKLLMKKGDLAYRGWRKYYYPLLNGLGTKMERKMVNNPDLKNIIVVSEGLKRNVMAHYQHIPEDKIRIIHNYADLSRFNESKRYREEVRRTLNLSENHLVGVIVALGDWQRKGLDILIDAVAIKKITEIKILVIGGGPIEQYQKLCSAKGVTDNFLFLGYQTRLEKFYGAADFFIFPTAFEAFPLVLLEASASGLPILASKVDGVKEIVEEGFNGLLFQRNREAIAEKLELIYQDRRLLEKLGMQAKGKTQVYTRERMIEKHRLFYNDLVKSNSSTAINNH